MIKGLTNTPVTLVEADENGNAEVKYMNDYSHLQPELLLFIRTGQTAETNFAFETRKDNSYWTIFPRLMSTIRGTLHVQRETSFGGDTGKLLDAEMDEELFYNGYAEQAFGEAIDILHKDGVRWLLMKNNGEMFFNYLFDLFCFQPYEKDPSYKVLRVTVPGIEGPCTKKLQHRIIYRWMRAASKKMRPI